MPLSGVQGRAKGVSKSTRALTRETHRARDGAFCCQGRRLPFSRKSNIGHVSAVLQACVFRNDCN
jgi:hypothetical protein